MKLPSVNKKKVVSSVKKASEMLDVSKYTAVVEKSSLLMCVALYQNNARVGQIEVAPESNMSIGDVVDLNTLNVIKLTKGSKSIYRAIEG